MKVAALTAALVAMCACAGRGGPGLDQTEAEAAGALRRGELTAAQSLAERGLALAGPESGSRSAWTFRLLRAESLVLQVKAQEAHADLTDALPATREFDSLRARQKYLQARAAVTEGRLQAALDVVDQGRSLAASRDVRFDLDVLAGQIRLRLGKGAEAESILVAAASEAAAAGDHYHQALAFNNLGMARLTSNRFDDALTWFERVLSLTDLERFAVYAASLSNAGTCYNELGEFERAVALQSRAVEAFERHGLTNQFVQALGELGRTYSQQDRAARALPYMRRAFEVANRAHMNADAALIAGNLAQALTALGQWDEATRFNDDATRIRTASGTGKLMWNTLNAAGIAAGRGRPDEARQLYAEAIAASIKEPAVQWQANAGLAHLALASHDEKHAAEYFERTLQIIEQTRSDLLKTDYKLSYLSSLIQFYREYVDALIAQGRTDRALEVADSSRGRVLAERQRTASPARVNVASFRRVAERSGDVMLFYWLQPKASWLWVVTAKDIHLEPLPAADQIEALVREHQKMIGSALADPLASAATPGDKLYAALVAPAAHWIPGGASVFVVPDGALHGLNFETLPVAGPKRHYWIEDVEVQIVPSLGLIGAGSAGAAARRRAPPAAAPSLLLFGSPTVSDPKFPALSYAGSEMAKVAGHFKSDRVVSFEGARASPAAYRSAQLDRFTLIHFTAHAAANVESPLDSAVILAAEGGAYKLYARDVAEQPMRAELVTVSACRSAGERAYSGEGLIGFAWAFLRAGAKRVIAGLWDVDDQSTAGLMDGLYARLAAGTPPSRALREAKLAMLHGGGSLAKPYYWGPFELFTVAP